MSAQADGEYAEALDNYYEALTLEEDPNDSQLYPLQYRYYPR
jgi:hypothetical protein